MSSASPTTPSIDEDLFAPSQPNPMEEEEQEAAPAVASQPAVATEYNTCIQEMNAASTCMEANIDDCGCFYEGIVEFRQEFPREIRKQFYSAQAWLPSTDLFFCEVANQRVCRNYQTVQSCCCTEQTTAYKDCFINNVLIYELPIPSGCYSTCESTVELRPDVAGGPAVVKEIYYDNDTNQNNTIITAVLASVLGVLVVVGTVFGILYCRKKTRKNKNGVGVDATKSPTLDSSSQERSSSIKKDIKAAEEGMCIHDNSADDDEDGSESSASSDNSTIRTKEMTHPRSFGDMMSLESKTPAVDITPSIYQAKEKKKHHSKNSAHHAMSPSKPGRIEEEEEEGAGTGSQSRTASYNVHELIGSSGGKVYPTETGDIHDPANRSIDDVKKDRDGTKEILYRLKTTQAELQRLMEKSMAEAIELPEDDPMSEWSRNEIMKELHEIKTKMMQLQDAKEFYENQLLSFKTELKLLRLENSNSRLKESLKSMEDRNNTDDDKSDPSLFSNTSRSSPSRSNNDDSKKDSSNKKKSKSKSKSNSSSQVRMQKSPTGHHNSSKVKLSGSNTRRSSYKKSGSSSRIDLAGNISMVQ